MSDHKEYKIRQQELTNNPYFKNFKEGFWVSPNGHKIIDVLASYEAESINIVYDNTYCHFSIRPVVWFYLFDDWMYLDE